MFNTNCPLCGGRAVAEGTYATLVGYDSPKGHNHDDNCRKRTYKCEDCGHAWIVSKQNTCPICDWVGRETCGCHPDPKVKNWPPEFRRKVGSEKDTGSDFLA